MKSEYYYIGANGKLMYESVFNTSCELPELKELSRDREVHGVKSSLDDELEQALREEDFELAQKIQNWFKDIDNAIYLSAH